jgi:hypothetical protein
MQHMNETLVLCATLLFNASAFAYTIEEFPILDRLKTNGVELSDQTEHWMKKWKGLDLENQEYVFPALGGHTSVTMKVRQTDPSKAKGKSMGSFVPRNGAGNPNTGIAYFNTAAILGYDSYFRPGVRYEAGPRAVAALKALIAKSPIKGKDRLENKNHILQFIAKGGPLKGYMKASNPDGVAFDAIVNSHAAPNGAPVSNHPIIMDLQATNPKPKAGTSLTLAKGFTGDALELAREYSVIMTLDVVLGQFDRYSGGNIMVINDDSGRAHIYAVDSDGAELGSSPSWSVRGAGWFSRYDRKVIAQLNNMYAFLLKPSTGYLGYTNAEQLVTDLGLYFELPPATYVERLKRNLNVLLDRVAAVQAKYGDSAYLD